MHQLARLSFGGDEVVPAARGFDVIADSEDSICQRITPVMVKEKPSI
jgi:hypothetical protein